MKELLTKLSKAKAEIKEMQISKEGKNTFSKYDYFTPSQVEAIVSKVCSDNGLLTTFDLLKNELGFNGVLTIYDIESDQHLTLNMATDIPEIKATNTAQQLGGCMTYTERYLKMSAFGITDNRLDFDTTENTQARQKKDPTEEEKTANFKILIDKQKEISENAGYDFVDDILIPCSIDTLEEAYNVLPIQRKATLDRIKREIANKGKTNE